MFSHSENKNDCIVGHVFHISRLIKSYDIVLPCIGKAELSQKIHSMESSFDTLLSLLRLKGGLQCIVSFFQIARAQNSFFSLT
jgi:hypothetical protein